MVMSYATERKIRIITKQLGTDWREKNPGRSIDAIYNEVVGDIRKNLFCKIDPEIKIYLDEMVDNYDMKMGELIERLIREEYEKYSERKINFSDDLANQFGGE